MVPTKDGNVQDAQFIGGCDGNTKGVCALIKGMKAKEVIVRLKVVQLKTFLKKRLLWLDKNIDAISQYSAESKVKKFNSNAN